MCIRDRFKTLLRGSPNMDSLIAIGSTAALVYGVFAIYRIGSVSYTHLDVYKRQLQDSTQQICTGCQIAHIGSNLDGLFCTCLLYTSRCV